MTTKVTSPPTADILAAAFEKHLPAFKKLTEEELLSRINFDVASAVSIVLGAVPALLGLRSELIVLPDMKPAYVDELQSVAYAALHAHMRAITAPDAVSDLPALTERARIFVNLVVLPYHAPAVAAKEIAGVPLATTTNYLPNYARMYYMTGAYLQALPVATGVGLYVGVNYKPTALNDLSSDTVAITFPDNNQGIITASAAAKLLLKGGAEVGAANNFRALANEERQSMLDDLRRRTINPTRMGYPDQKYDWSGG
jgi:hypothetical protein